jgi:hypothetical protein
MRRGRLFSAFLLLLAAIPAAAGSLPINRFGGINTDDSPLTLQDGQTPDSQDVVTDNPGGGLEGRKGYVEFSTTPANDIWSFQHSNGTRYLIAASTVNTLVATTGNGTFSTAVSTVSSSYVTVGAVLGDRFYFSNKGDGLKYWDGTSTTTVSSTLKFDNLVAHKGRLFGSGVPGAERTIYASAFNDGTDWTLVTDPADDDPAQYVVGGANGDILTALYSSFKDGLIWFQGRAFGGITGDDRSDFAVRTYSDEVGTAYKDSIQDCAGLLRFLGPLRTVWEWDGARLTKISEDIDALMGTVAQGDASARSWTLTSQADWQAGTLGAGLNAIDAPGDLFYEMEINQDTDNGTGFSVSEVAQSFIPDSNFPVTGAKVYTYIGASTGTAITITFTIRTDNAGLPGSTVLSTGTTNYTVTTPSLDSVYREVSFSPVVTLTSGTTYWLYLSPSPSVRFVGNSVDVYPAGRSWGSTAPSGTQADDLRFAVFGSSSVFRSAAFNVGTGISSWGTFSATSLDDGGSHTFEIYGDTDTSLTRTNAATFTSSQTITNGSIPTIATAAYVTIGDIFTRTASTQEPTLYETSLQWNEGSLLRVASGFPNQRYWLAVSVSSTANNRVLVFDKRRQWQRYAMPIRCMAVYSGNTYFGNASGVFQAESGYTDDGAAISAYYRTPTHSPSGPSLYSVFDELWITADRSDASLVTTFQVDGINTDYTIGGASGFAMNVQSGTQNRKIPFPFSQVQQGKQVNFKWTVSGSSYWRILGAELAFMSDRYPTGG